LNGESFTFWLFTKGDRCVKGEGRSDAEALDKVRAIINPSPWRCAEHGGYGFISDCTECQVSRINPGTARQP
jgi:hypothetical protein